MTCGPQDERAAQGTLLLVEDNPTDVFVIKEVIAQSKLKLALHVVDDGQKALRFLSELAEDEKIPYPALILLDLNLPKVSGIEVLREMRRGRCINSRIIIVTSSTAEADRNAAERLGIEAYFQKTNDLGAYTALGDLMKKVINQTS